MRAFRAPPEQMFLLLPVVAVRGEDLQAAQRRPHQRQVDAALPARRDAATCPISVQRRALVCSSRMTPIACAPGPDVGLAHAPAAGHPSAWSAHRGAAGQVRRRAATRRRSGRSRGCGLPGRSHRRSWHYACPTRTAPWARAALGLAGSRWRRLALAGRAPSLLVGPAGQRRLGVEERDARADGAGEPGRRCRLPSDGAVAAAERDERGDDTWWLLRPE